MPAATKYNRDEVDELAEKERRHRSDYIKAAWMYYKGHHKKPLKVKPGQPDDNVILNVSKILIDRGVSMLFGRGVEFQLDETDQTPAEDYLETVWDGIAKNGNQKQIRLNDIALNGYVTGFPVIRLTEPTETSLPRIITLNPAMVHAFWKPDDMDTVLWYTIYYNDNARQDIVFDGDAWLIYDLSRDKYSKWQVDDESEWLYSWPPIYGWKNLPNPNEFYSVSDIDHADLNDKINFIASNTNRILQKHAHPRTILLGASLGDVEVKDEIGGILAINKPAGEVSVNNLEMQSDLQSSMAYLEDLKAAFFSLGASVDITTIKDRLGQVTNFGLKVLFKDAIDRLTIKRALYGDALIEINRRVLELGGFGSENYTTLIWPDALPMNQLETIEAIERMIALGLISKETAATKLGIDWDAEMQKLTEQQGSQDVGSLILQNLAFNRGQNGL